LVGFGPLPTPDVPSDQGISYRLQHSATRQLTLGKQASLTIGGRCEPGPCTVEIRIQTQGAGTGETTSGPSVTFGPERHEATVLVDQALAKEGIVEIQLVRSRAIRALDGSAAAQRLEIDRLVFSGR
jgi:hypothetical protein